MGLLNELSCLKIGSGNTGSAKCGYVPGLVYQLLFVPKGTLITQTQQASIKSTIDGKLKENNASLRWYIVGEFEGAELKNTEDTTSTTSYGQLKFGRQGLYGFKFEYTNGGLPLHQNVYKLLNLQHDAFDVLLLDKDNEVIFGTMKGTSLKGFSLNYLKIPNVTFATGESSTTKFHIEIQMQDSSEINLQGGIVGLGTGESISDFKSLVQLWLQPIAPVTAGLVKIRPMAGQTNLFETYPTEFVASLFSAANTATGAAVTISSVTPNASSKTYDVQMLITDPDYPTVGSSVTVNVGGVTALGVAGIQNISEASVNIVI